MAACAKFENLFIENSILYRNDNSKSKDAVRMILAISCDKLSKTYIFKIELHSSNVN